MNISWRKIIILALIALSIIMIGASAFGQRIHYESYYQEEFGKIINGTTEITLEDRTRVDIITDTHAIEVDFASKWAEGIGQALYYGEVTGKKPGVLLIMEDFEKDEKYLQRLLTVTQLLNMDVWIIDSNLKWKKIEFLFDYQLND